MATPKRKTSKKLFDEGLCAIPAVFCGDGDSLPTKKDAEHFYFRFGTRSECLKKGIGAGTHIERKTKLPDSSLQQIKYVGEIHEANFKRAGIKTVTELVRYAKGKSSDEIEEELMSILTKKGGGLDKRAYNSTLLYLYRHGVGNLPPCRKIPTGGVSAAD
jgi:hypothetical protein